MFTCRMQVRWQFTISCLSFEEFHVRLDNHLQEWGHQARAHKQPQKPAQEMPACL
jgi:hypothetical protein